MIAALVLGIVGVGHLVPSSDAWLLPQRTTQTQNRSQVQADWKRRSIPSARLSADLPMDPDRAVMELKDATRKQTSNANASRLIFQEVLFRFAFAEYDPELDVNLDVAADSAIKSLKGTIGLTELKHTKKSLEVSKAQAVLIEATYQFQGHPVSYRLLIAGEDNKIWQASAMFRTPVKEQEDLAKRVIDSVRLER